MEYLEKELEAPLWICFSLGYILLIFEEKLFFLLFFRRKFFHRKNFRQKFAVIFEKNLSKNVQKASQNRVLQTSVVNR